MDRYWFRIAAGACVVFGVGMFANQLFSQGAAQVESAFAQIPTIMATVPERFGPLLVDGDTVGAVERIRLARDGDDHATRTMQVTVNATPAGLERLGRCTALGGTVDAMFETGLTCVSDTPVVGYERFGTLAVNGAEVTLALLATEEDVAEFAADDAGNEAHVVDIRADSTGGARVSIVGADEKERVQIVADSNGARIEIRDDHGQPVFSFRADSTGLKLNASER